MLFFSITMILQAEFVHSGMLENVVNGICGGIRLAFNNRRDGKSSTQNQTRCDKKVPETDLVLKAFLKN